MHISHRSSKTARILQQMANQSVLLRSVMIGVSARRTYKKVLRSYTVDCISTIKSADMVIDFSSTLLDSTMSTRLYHVKNAPMTPCVVLAMLTAVDRQL